MNKLIRMVNEAHSARKLLYVSYIVIDKESIIALIKKCYSVSRRYAKFRKERTEYEKLVGWSYQTGHSDPKVTEQVQMYSNKMQKLDKEFMNAVMKFSKLNSMENEEVSPEEIKLMMVSNGGFEWTLDHTLHTIKGIINDDMKLYFE